MRIPVRMIADGWRAGVGTLFAVALDVLLIGVFQSHLRQAFAAQRYRPVYRRTGRRNRVRV
jgi:hypothetical protein